MDITTFMIAVYCLIEDNLARPAVAETRSAADLAG